MGLCVASLGLVGLGGLYFYFGGDPDTARAIEGFGSRWCIHSYHTYDSHPYINILKSSKPKGLGIELRVIGCDPDKAEERARRKSYIILSTSTDKVHGMREYYIVDHDGFCLVACKKI